MVLTKDFLSAFDKSVEYYAGFDYGLRIFEVKLLYKFPCLNNQIQIHLEDILRIELEENQTLHLTLVSCEHLILRCQGEGVHAWYSSLWVRIRVSRNLLSYPPPTPQKIKN